MLRDTRRKLLGLSILQSIILVASLPLGGCVDNVRVLPPPASSATSPDLASPSSAVASRSDDAHPVAAAPAASPHDQAIRLYSQAIDKIRQNYIMPKDELALTDIALKGLLTSLDGHSNYMTAQEYREFNDNAKEAFGGIGIVIEATQDYIRVMSPVDGGPALRAGVATDWHIVSIDGASARGISLNEATRKLHGEPGTTVTVMFKDTTGRLVSLALKRELIHVRSVYQRRIGNIGYIHITGFTQVCASDFADAEKTLLERGPLSGLMLDLRNNGGGFITAAVAVASHFVKATDVIVRTGATAATAVSTMASGTDPALATVPIVILVNGGTASAAEIVTAALHDNQRATVIGTTTFGKGLVQTIFPLDGGTAGAVSVTTARYYTPAGHSIQQVGIVPDLMAARTDKEARDIVGGPASYSEQTLMHSLDNEIGLKRAPIDAIEGPAAGRGAVGPDTPLFVRSLPNDADVAGDFQIQRALDVLRFGSIDAARRARSALTYRRQQTKPTITPQ